MANIIVKNVKGDLLADLTNATANVTNIEKINFSSVKATMYPNKDETKITLNYDGIEDGPFELSLAPKDDSLTVKRAVLDILGQINLQQLCFNLEASAALIDVAYNACNGIGGAHKNLYQLRTDIFDTVRDSVSMSDAFRKAAQMVIRSLVDTYATLSNEDNYDAANVKLILNSIKQAASGMEAMAQEMSERFVELEKRVFDEGANIVSIEEGEIKHKEELQKQLADFKAQLDAFNASKKDLENQIAQAQKLYAKYDNEARELNNKANTMEIVGAVVGGLGQIAGGISSAVSGYYGSKTPKININSSADDKKDPKKEEKTPTTEVKDPADVSARKQRLGENKAELDLIELRLPEYATKIAALENEKNPGTSEETKNKESDKADPTKDDKTKTTSKPAKKRTDEEIDKEIKTVKEKQSADINRKAVLETEIKNDNTYVNARLAASIGESVSDAAKKIEDKFDNIGSGARTAAAAKDKLAQEMLKLKFELESKNTENLAKIAEFTQRIKNGNIEHIDTSVIINSLQLAVTCMSTVGATLATVALFWKSIERACENLASNDTIDRLNNTIEAKEGNIEDIVLYVTKNRMFGKNWFIMESQWQALYIVCNAYYLSCTSAKATLDVSLRRVETDRREHWKLAQEMAKELEEKLNVSLRSAQSKDAAFQRRVELAQQEKEKMLLDINSNSVQE